MKNTDVILVTYRGQHVLVYLISDHLRTALGSGLFTDPLDFICLIFEVIAENLSAMVSILNLKYDMIKKLLSNNLDAYAYGISCDCCLSRHILYRENKSVIAEPSTIVWI